MATLKDHPDADGPRRSGWEPSAPLDRSYADRVGLSPLPDGVEALLLSIASA
jgi:hypothetical protein